MSKKLGFYPESAKGISEDHVVMGDKPKQKKEYDYALNPHDSLNDELKEDSKNKDSKDL